MKKRTVRSIVAWVILVLALAFAVYLLFWQNALQYGLIVLGVICIGFLVWKAFVKTGNDKLIAKERKEKELNGEIDTLRREVNSLSRRLAEKDNTKMNVVEMNPVLHIAMMTVDTFFVRTFQRERDRMTFNGALKVDLCAEYGIRLEDVLFKFDEPTNCLYLANFKPGMISYSKKQLHWEIAQASRKRRGSLLNPHPGSVMDETTEAYTKEMCEEIRTELEKEIDTRRVDELEWMSKPLSQQVIGMLKYAIHLPQVEVKVVEQPDDSFVSLPVFQQQMNSLLLDDMAFARTVIERQEAAAKETPVETTAEVIAPVAEEVVPVVEEVAPVVEEMATPVEEETLDDSSVDGAAV